MPLGFHSRRNRHRLFYCRIAKTFAHRHFHLLCDFCGRYPCLRPDLFPRRCPHQHGKILLPYCSHRHAVDWHYSMDLGKTSPRINESNRRTTESWKRHSKPNSATHWHPLLVLAFSMMLGIQKHQPNYAERKQLLFDLVKVQPRAKLLIQQPAEHQGANNSVAKIANALSQKGSLWGLSYETAIASKWIGLNETRTAKIMSTEEIKDWPTTDKQIADSLFIGAPFEQPQPINRLNHRYFRFAKKQKYRTLHEQQIDKLGCL